MHFRSVDHADHVFLTSTPDVFVSLVFCIPLRHLDDLLDAEGITPARTEPRLLLPDDPLLQSCLLRLGSGIEPHRLTGMPPGRYRRHIRPTVG